MLIIKVPSNVNLKVWHDRVETAKTGVDKKLIISEFLVQFSRTFFRTKTWLRYEKIFLSSCNLSKTVHHFSLWALHEWELWYGRLMKWVRGKREGKERKINIDIYFSSKITVDKPTGFFVWLSNFSNDANLWFPSNIWFCKNIVYMWLPFTESLHVKCIVLYFAKTKQKLKRLVATGILTSLENSVKSRQIECTKKPPQRKKNKLMKKQADGREEQG